MNNHVLFFLCLFCTVYSCKSDQKLSEIRETQNEFTTVFSVDQDSLKQGEYIKYDLDELVVEKANYTDNLLNGERTLYFPNGKIEIEEPYTNGIMQGTYKEYFEDGSIKQEMNYSKGILGDVVKRYYQNGNLKETVNFVENEENGPFTEYHENGKMAWKGSYLNGDNEVDSLYEYDEEEKLIKVMYCDSLSICRTIRTSKSSN